MSLPDLLPGLSSAYFHTKRIRTHAILGAALDGEPVFFLHGNASAARFWEETLVALPKGLRGIAPDLRGYGDTDPEPIDATRGLRDFADDLHALVEHQDIAGAAGQVHLVGWSAGAGVAMQYAIDHPGRVASIALVAPMSPFGFGGTKDDDGRPCWPDFAGSGGGTANPEFVRLIKAGDASEESDFSPRNVMNKFYFKPPFRVGKPREDVFVGEILKTRVGDAHYPGDASTSSNWPGVAPGVGGMNNAISPRYCNLSAFGAIERGPRVLWIRGADDQIVSDTSLFDFGYLGQLGAVPGWPGEGVYPPQPMVSQLRHVLRAYESRGGLVTEHVIRDAGHSPHIENPGEFQNVAFRFLLNKP
jgi:pimeloyl-ACP methyl ester carboxylesterase